MTGEVFLQWLKHFSLFIKTVRKIEPFSLLTDSEALRMLMYFLLKKKMILWCVHHHHSVHISFNPWMCHFMTHPRHITIRKFRSGWRQVLEGLLNSARSVHFFALYVGKREQLQMLQVVWRRVAFGQLVQMHMKTSCLLLQSPPLILSQT